MTIITNARFPGSARRVDIAIKGGAIAAITPAGSRISVTATGGAAPIIDADGRWAIPGLWDCHTHFTQWAQTFGRLDLIGARSASEAMSILRNHLEARRNSPEGLDPDTSSWWVCGSAIRCGLVTSSRRWPPSTRRPGINRSHCPAPTCIAAGSIPRRRGDWA